MTNNNGISFSTAMASLFFMILATANYINGCKDRYYQPRLDQASYIERIVIEDSKAYSINGLGQTNYFRFNGTFYEPSRDSVVGARK